MLVDTKNIFIEGNKSSQSGQISCDIQDFNGLVADRKQLLLERDQLVNEHNLFCTLERNRLNVVLEQGPDNSHILKREQEAADLKRQVVDEKLADCDRALSTLEEVMSQYETRILSWVPQSAPAAVNKIRFLVTFLNANREIGPGYIASVLDECVDAIQPKFFQSSRV